MEIKGEPVAVYEEHKYASIDFTKDDITYSLCFELHKCTGVRLHKICDGKNFSTTIPVDGWGVQLMLNDLASFLLKD